MKILKWLAITLVLVVAFLVFGYLPYFLSGIATTCLLYTSDAADE